jgi:DNA-binding NarL/FixJ family response regulator
MKVLIADDHSIVREGLKQYIKTIEEVRVIDEAVNGNEAWEKIKEFGYDVVILDLSMPGMSGLDVLRNIKEKNMNTRVLILSVHPMEQYAIQAFKMGASGYLSKDSAYGELTLAIKKIALGGRYVAASFAEKLVFDNNDSAARSPHEKLSKREFQVMIMLAEGKHITEIAKKLFLSEGTVSTYRFRILQKMGLKNNAELTMYSIKNSLIQ